MNAFKDLGIKVDVKTFTGDKISAKKIINSPITVLDYKIGESKQKEGTDCLTLQIKYKDENRVVFTGSKILMEQIKQVPRERFPFQATIKNDNDYYEFT